MTVIEQVSSHKILGVVIDSQVNYESHIDETFQTHRTLEAY